MKKNSFLSILCPLLSAFCAKRFALCFFLIFNFTFIIETTATIHYVSKTGNDIPPFLSWEDAADSIQSAINVCAPGDTVLVANGVYYESIIVNEQIWLVGLSMDSTVVDGTNLGDVTVEFQSDGYIRYFTIKGRGEGQLNTIGIGVAAYNNVIIEYCKITDADNGIGASESSLVVDQCIITNVRDGIHSSCVSCNRIVKNSLIITKNTSYPYTTAILTDGGDIIASNNIIIDFNSNSSTRGITSGLFLNVSNSKIFNNIVSGFDDNIEEYISVTDSAIVHNNVSSYSYERGFTIHSNTDMRNNIVYNNTTGVYGPNTNSDYNLYWKNNTNTTGGLAEHDIIADPMFVNDTIPVYGGSYDYHLQKYSPAIDAGDPNILDVDSSRSDIGLYIGGTYTPENLAPRAPVNLSAIVENGTVLLRWNKNSEADTSNYRVYRSETANFQIDSTNLDGTTTDTFFVEPTPVSAETLYYKVTAVDVDGLESLPSEEIFIDLTSAVENEPITINDYHLYNNYPNPFNPSTKIGYKLISRGYVKLLVYDITGSLVSVLVNEVQEAGYYEIEFNAGGRGEKQEVRDQLASGIYLYRIEVVGEGNIPKFSDMKKMILIK